jgi:hypothetical protein
LDGDALDRGHNADSVPSSFGGREKSLEEQAKAAVEDAKKAAVSISDKAKETVQQAAK